MVRSCYCALLLAAWGIAARAEPGPPPATVEVELAVEADAAKPTLMFVVKNIGEKNIYRGDLGVSTNRIVALLPSGQVDVHAISVEASNLKSPAEIAPGETVVWRATLNEFPSWPGPWPEVGLYRMYWEFGGVRSGEIAIFSNKARPDARPNGFRRRNLTTPKAALWTLYQGIYSDLNGLTIALHTDWDPASQAASKALFNQAMASIHFLADAEARFGKDVNELDWAYRAGEDVRRAIEEGQVVFPPYFDEALLTPKDWPEPMRMVRAGNKWHVSASNFLTVDGKVRPDLLLETEVLKRMTEEVRAGKFATAQEVRWVMHDRLEKWRDPPAATNPTATRPAR